MTSLPVKICGITNQADAAAALAAGADALGFNLYPGSKRHVEIEEIGGWVKRLPAGARRVAVMVNPSMREAKLAQSVFDVVQLHGDETPAFCAELAASGPVWKALALGADWEADAADEFEAEALLLDAFVPGAFGGTGQLIDLARAADFILRHPERQVWLSGGLNPENVAAAVRIAHPFGVDVASGVESKGDPRRKDVERVGAFIRAARQG